jgi:hypothetical protein
MSYINIHLLPGNFQDFNTKVPARKFDDPEMSGTQMGGPVRTSRCQIDMGMPETFATPWEMTTFIPK